MFVTGYVPIHVASIKWQDYRGFNSGMVVYYNSDPVAELPIREIPEDTSSDVIADPNYETGTFGVYGCKHSKIRAAFVKNKAEYIFFMTKYAGTAAEYLDDLMITGFYRINKFADTQKLHIRYLNEYSCISEKSCMGLRSDKVHFVSAEDAFMLTPAVLEKWGNSTRVTRQTKIMLSEEDALEVVKYLESKENRIDDYIEITEDLMPDYDEDGEE